MEARREDRERSDKGLISKLLVNGQKYRGFTEGIGNISDDLPGVYNSAIR